MRYEFLISRHYFGSHRSKSFIRSISVISIITVVLAVAVPIIVLSIMNGLHSSIGEKIVALDFDLRILPEYGEIPNFEEMTAYLEKKYPDSINSVIPYFSSVGLIRRASKYQSTVSSTQTYSIRIVGLRNEDLKKNQPFLTNFKLVNYIPCISEPSIQKGEFISLQPANSLFIGYALDCKLRRISSIKDMELMIPTGDLKLDASMSFKPFQLAGTYTAGYSDFDSSIAIIPFSAQKEIFKSENFATGLGIHIKEEVTIHWLLKQLEQDDHLKTLFHKRFKGYDTSKAAQESSPFRVVNTRDEGFFTDFFREKQTIFYVLLLMVIAAFVTIYITLHVIVLDKRREIGILKSFGTSVWGIQKIFIFEGMLIGIIGTIIGVFVGIFVCISMNDIVLGIEWAVTQYNIHIAQLPPDKAAFHIMPQDIFYLNTFPIKLRIGDILLQSTGAIFVALLASYLSSKRASMQKPLAVLRMEG